MNCDTGQHPEAEDTPSGESIHSQIDLDMALSRRRPRYVRLLIGAVLVALVVAIVASQWHTLTARWQQPTSTPLAPATALVLGSVSRGTVVFNGKKLAYHDGVVVSLHQGANTFIFESPPFNARRCTLTWPSGAASDDCYGAGQRGPFYSEHPAVQITGKMVHVDYVIALPFSLADLPQQLQQDALDAVKQTLAREAAADQATVRPGEHYATSIDANGNTTSAVAKEPLTATPLLTIDTNRASSDCLQIICGDTGTPDQLLHLPTDGPLRWAVGASVLVGWRFTTILGRTVASVQFPGRVRLGMALDLVNGSEGQIVPSRGDISLPEGDLHTETMFEICNASGTALIANVPQLTAYSVGSYNAQGCRITDSRISGSGITLIWRFGVLLAADEAAHRQAPQLPLATASERAAIPAS